MNPILLFIFATIINVVLSTIRSICTIKCGKWLSALTNAICYGFYPLIVMLTAKDTVTIWVNMIITAVVNFVCVWAIKLVEEKTNIPYIVKMLNDGPIHNAEQIIKDDIVKMYTNVLSELLERTDGAIEKRLQEIRESKDGNLRAKIKELTQSIERDEREIPAKKQAISEILQSITNETTSFFESLNIR